MKEGLEAVTHNNAGNLYHVSGHSVVSACTITEDEHAEGPCMQITKLKTIIRFEYTVYKC